MLATSGTARCDGGLTLPATQPPDTMTRRRPYTPSSTARRVNRSITACAARSLPAPCKESASLHATHLRHTLTPHSTHHAARCTSAPHTLRVRPRVALLLRTPSA